jgi:hypothetical protein
MSDTAEQKKVFLSDASDRSSPSHDDSINLKQRR